MKQRNKNETKGKCKSCRTECTKTDCGRLVLAPEWNSGVYPVYYNMTQQWCRRARCNTTDRPIAFQDGDVRAFCSDQCRANFQHDVYQETLKERRELS